MRLDDLGRLLDGLFLPGQFEDGCRNGLVIPGQQGVKRLLLGVSLTRDLVDRAMAMKAEALLVHHGVFLTGPWSLPPSILPVVKRLVENEISLFVYHLPMDAHLEFSHNRSLLEGLDPAKPTPFCPYGLVSDLRRPLTVDEVQNRLPAQSWAQEMGVRPIPGVTGLEWNKGRWICRCGPEPVRRVAVVSGRGGSELELAAAAGADLFITGEISEHHPELAAIHRIGLIALGHGLSETGGLVRLGEWLRKMTPLEVGLAPLDNPL